MSYKDDYDSAKQALEFGALLVVAAVLFAFVWPIFLSYFMGERLLDFRFGILIVILLDLALAIILLLIGLAGEIKVLAVNGIVFFVLAVVYTVSWASGFSSPATLGHWEEFNERIADEYDTFVGELTSADRREYFREVYFPEMREQRVASRAYRRFQKSGPARDGKRVITRFFSDLRRLKVRSAEQYLHPDSYVQDLGSKIGRQSDYQQDRWRRDVDRLRDRSLRVLDIEGDTMWVRMGGARDDQFDWDTDFVLLKEDGTWYIDSLPEDIESLWSRN